jgi:cystathionine gamma-synthase
VTQEHRHKAGFDTRAIHAGYEPDPTTGAVIPPIYATSTYKQDGVGGLRGGYEYSRSANPTRTALEGALAALEEGERGFAFASGLAAEDTILRALTRPGDHCVIPDDAYGGTFRLFDKVEQQWGLDYTPAAVSDLDAVHAAVRPGTTRMGGAVVVRDLDLAEAITFHQNAMGAVPGPFDCFLTHRGIKTLGVRMDRHCDNAEQVVDFLTRHPKVSQVIYPGLPEHPGHAVAAKQMKRFGGMVSFRHADGEQAAIDTCARAEVFTLGESLGGVESLIEHPGRMTHMSVAGTELEVPADLVRLSVGIETADDLLADLDRALTASG